MHTMFALLFSGLVAQAGGADGPVSPVVEKMQALSFLVGEWEGEGWMQLGPQDRKTVKVRETVQSRLGGRALLVEGRGTPNESESGDDHVGHDALALITWDPRKGEYSMRAITARNGAVDPKVEVGDKSIVWSFDTPVGGSVRYTIKLNEKGQWVESGEFSRDGKEWHQFFEMTLTKKK